MSWAKWIIEGAIEIALAALCYEDEAKLRPAANVINVGADHQSAVKENHSKQKWGAILRQVCYKARLSTAEKYK